MTIAIIGTGFAGLAIGWFLIESGRRVTFFDKKGIGQGASGIAAGLLHPYVGEESRRSLWADDALAEAKKLLALAPRAILEEGILRIAQNDVQREALLNHCAVHRDVELLEKHHFFIHSGLVIDTSAYLQTLYLDCVSKGASFNQREIKALSELRDYDHIVLAMGHEVGHLLPWVGEYVSKTKGQLVNVALNSPMKSTVAKGYIAKGPREGVYHWGSTYERNFSSEEPDLNAALAILEKNDFPLPLEKTILDCRAGVRLARRGHYLPFVDRMEKKLWWIGALGSRGLLYHALLGRKLAEAIVNENENLIPRECKIRKKVR